MLHTSSNVCEIFLRDCPASREINAVFKNAKFSCNEGICRLERDGNAIEFEEDYIEDWLGDFDF